MAINNSSFPKYYQKLLLQTYPFSKTKGIDW